MALKYEVILQAGVEGGGFDLLGLAKTKGWLFTLKVNDCTWQLLDNSSLGAHTQSRFVDNWPAALNLISQFHWEDFFPRTIHSEFRQWIYEAYVERFQSKNIDVKGRNGKWEMKCRDTSDKIVYKEQSLNDLKWAIKL